MSRLFKVTSSELRSSFTLPRLIGLLIAGIIPLIAPIVSGNIQDHGHGLADSTMHMLGRIFSEGIMYALGIRIVLLLKDKATLDKNRVTYLTFGKGQVLFAKVFADAALFMISIIFLSIAGPLVVVLKNHGTIEPSFYWHAITFIIGMLSFYVLISVGMRFISSTVKTGLKRGVLLGIFMFIVIGTYVVMSIVVGVVEEVGNFYGDHAIIMSIVPIVNITSPIRVLYGQDPVWTVIPLIVQSLAIALVLWKPLSTNLKEYLCG